MSRAVLLVSLAFSTACMHATGVANDSPNAIAVQTALGADEAYQAAVAAVLAAGYTLDIADATLRTLETAPLMREDLAVSLSAAVEGDARAVVVLRGRFAMPGVCGEGPIRRVGASGCRAMQAWGELEGVAARIGGVATPVLLD
jgi:hypothetical protein